MSAANVASNDPNKHVVEVVDDDIQRPSRSQHFKNLPTLFLGMLANKDNIIREFRGKDFIPDYSVECVRENPVLAMFRDEVVEDDEREAGEYANVYESATSQPPLNENQTTPTPVPSTGSDKTRKVRRRDYVYTDDAEDTGDTKDTRADESKTSSTHEHKVMGPEEPQPPPKKKESYEEYLPQMALPPPPPPPTQHQRPQESRNRLRPRPSGIDETIPESVAINKKLRSQGIYTLQSDRDRKREVELQDYINKIEYIRNSNEPSIDKREIPKFNAHSDLKEVQAYYRSLLKKMDVDNYCRTAKLFIMGSCYVIEALARRFGIDMAGLTTYIAKPYFSYDSLLMEIGERRGGMAQWSLSPESKLGMFMALNIGAFYFIKRSGVDITESGNSLNRSQGIFSLLPSILSMFGGKPSSLPSHTPPPSNQNQSRDSSIPETKQPNLNPHVRQSFRSNPGDNLRNVKLQGPPSLDDILSSDDEATENTRTQTQRSKRKSASTSTKKYADIDVDIVSI